MSLAGNTSTSIAGLLNKSISVGILGNTIIGISNIITGEPAKGVTITGVTLASSTNSVDANSVNINYEDLYRNSTITYVRVEDSNIVVTMTTGDTFILQVSSDNFITQALSESYV